MFLWITYIGFVFLGFFLALCVYGVLMWLWKLVTDSNRELLRDFVELQKETDKITDSIEKTAKLFKIEYEVESRQPLSFATGSFITNSNSFLGYWNNNGMPFNLIISKHVTISSNTDNLPPDACVLSIKPVKDK